MPGLPQAVAVVASGVKGLFTAGGFFTTTAGKIVGSIALSAGAQALQRLQAKRPGDRPVISAAERLVNISQPLTEMRLVLGRTRVGGVRGLDAKANGALHYVTILAAHPIEAIRQVWLDKTEQTLEPDGEVTGSPQAGFANLRFYTGRDGQAVDPVLLANVPQVTKSFDFAGLSYVAVTARSATDTQVVYPNGRHWDVSALVDGANDVLDPRTGQRGFTRNPALLYAYICERKGRKTDPGEIAREANVCDEPVTDRFGVTRARYTFDGVFEDGQDLNAMLSAIAAACDGMMYERSDGGYGLLVGRWIAPTITLTDRSFERLSIRQSRFDEKALTEAVGVYTSPQHDYLEQSTGTWVADPVAVPNRHEFDELVGSDNHNQAWRLVVRGLAVKRAAWDIEGEIGPLRYVELLKAREGDGSGRFVRVVHELGIDAFFEVTRLTLAEDARSATLSAHSVTPEDFSPDPALEPDAPERGAASLGGEPVPTGLKVEALSASALRASWSSPPFGYKQELDWRVTGGDWATVQIAEDVTTHDLTGLADGATYEVALRNVSVLSISSPRGEIVRTVTAASSTAPGPVTDAEVGLVGDDVLVSWTASAAPYDRARLWRSSAPDFATAQVVGHELGSPEAAASFLDQPSPGQWHYWIEAINESGKASTRVGPLTVSVV